MFKLKDFDETVIDINKITNIDGRRLDQDTHGLIFELDNATNIVCKYDRWDDLIVDVRRLSDYFKRCFNL